MCEPDRLWRGDCQLLLVLVLGLFPVRVKRLFGIVGYCPHNSKAFSPSFTEKYPVSNGEELWALHETERHQGFIAGTDKITVNVDDSARLANGTNMQHCLILALDGGSVGED